MAENFLEELFYWHPRIVITWPEKETKITRLKKNALKRVNSLQGAAHFKGRQQSRAAHSKGYQVTRTASKRSRERRKNVKFRTHDDGATVVTRSTSATEHMSQSTPGVEENNRPSPDGTRSSCPETCGCIPNEDDTVGGVFGAFSVIQDALLCNSACHGGNMIGRCVEFDLCRNVVFEDGDEDDELTLSWDCSPIRWCRPYNTCWHDDNSVMSEESDDTPRRRRRRRRRPSIVPPLAVLVYNGKEEGTSIEVGDPRQLDAYYNSLVLTAKHRKVERVEETNDKLHPLVLAHGAGKPDRSIEIEDIGIVDPTIAIAYVVHYFKITSLATSNRSTSVALRRSPSWIYRNY
jgi:hypothetical protein